MSLGNRLVVPVISLLFLAFLAGCGSSKNNTVPPPGGAFTNSNLKGTYVFTVVGSDTAGDLLTTAGTMTADGNGNLTGGIFDVNNPNGAGLLPALAVGSGSKYDVTSDGRGSIIVNTSAGTFGFDFVLASSEGGKITEFDTSGTGSGTLELQSAVSQADIAGSYVFNFSGTSGIGASFCGLTGSSFMIPLSTVGAFTLDASGNISSGVEDFNNNCSSSGNTGLTITGGSLSLSTIPGTATITSNAGTFHFDVFPVSSSDLKFIETDPVSVMIGEAFTQTSTIASGASVFTVAGFDTVAQGSFAAAGIVDTDGNGNVTAAQEDINDAGTASSITNFTGSYTALTGGRSVLTLNGFVNGGGGLGCSSCQFAIYPSSGGLQIMEIDNGGMTNGIATAQTATSLASSQGYGMDLTGSNSSGEEDDIAEFTNNNGTFTGLIDFNDQGSTTFDQKFSSSYSPDATLAGRGVVTGGSNAPNLVTYVVDSSTTVFVETDSTQIGLGSIVLQNAGAQSNLAASHLAVARMRPGANKALKRR
jgi:hypothetical protein